MQIEVPELAHVDFKETSKIEDYLKVIPKISVETNEYNYSFIPKSIYYLLNDQNSQELANLESVL
ncbi:hypothetical protein ACOWO9_09885 [Leuconostoc mesenteroides]|mgnify:CR=1 FL=1|uniref:hypothetical protein n=1 Tax=Leuconostoc mesenteroides TaxID=1245 RepID=UPI003C4911DA